ncbi:MAG: tRNA pseudouridine(38-40) synthase TruA [Deltaproteobacteria bacterium]|nr:tRNA pseudouridine(38-40) synthase TruA [Deltaproteobacteria bacterium]
MPIFRNVKVTLAYDGSGFNGWQIQPGLRTVQGVLEDALGKTLGDIPRIVASGRTDIGVHALGQVLNIHIGSTIPAYGLLRGLNSILPDDIAIRSVEDVALEFHARYMAKSKIYVYSVDTFDTPSPFLRRYSLHVRHKLDIPAMAEAAGFMVGEHDFSSFMGAGSLVKSTKRMIIRSSVIEKGCRIYYVVEGSGFLRHMVRNIVGTLLLIGKGKLSPYDIKGILDAKDRSKAGPTAPPQGLYLVGVKY